MKEGRDNNHGKTGKRAEEGREEIREGWEGFGLCSREDKRERETYLGS